MSKQEATRLADALDDSFCPMCHQAAAMLRQWPEGEPVALESVHLTRDTRGMCVVRVNGRVAICDNGDIIDHMATLEWFAAPPAKPDFGSAAHALDDALVSAHLGTLESFPNPKAALKALEAWNDQLALDPAVSPEAAKLHERIAELEAENANLRTVMVAAAEEIHQHWDAHCDAEGYGPANLMRRLEEGIAAQYGYTAGAFTERRNRIAALERELANAYAEGRKDEREEWTAEFKPSGGGCTCAGPDGPCESCEANRAAYEEWLAERPWHARIAALEAEVTALRADAERYRWLRANKHYSILIGAEGFGYTFSQVEHWTNEQNEAKVDAAIDAARGKT